MSFGMHFCVFQTSRKDAFRFIFELFECLVIGAEFGETWYGALGNMFIMHAGKRLVLMQLASFWGIHNGL